MKSNWFIILLNVFSSTGGHDHSTNSSRAGSAPSSRDSSVERCQNAQGTAGSAEDRPTSLPQVASTSRMPRAAADSEGGDGDDEASLGNYSTQTVKEGDDDTVSAGTVEQFCEQGRYVEVGVIWS
jgi:hypothetical protein